jgi:hypothetical protein
MAADADVRLCGWRSYVESGGICEVGRLLRADLPVRLYNVGIYDFVR